MGFFSYKQLAAYMDCPLLFKQREVDKLPVEENPRRTFLGNLLGSLVERMYVETWWRSPNLLGRLTAELEPTARILEQVEGIVWPPGARAQVMTIARDTLPKIIDVMRREKLVAPVVRTEFDVQVPVGRHTAVGRADLVLDFGAGGTIVIDVKAGGTLGRFVKTNQLRFYALGLYAMTGVLPRRAGFWWLRHATVAWKRMGEKSLRLYLAQLTAAIDGLRGKDWTPKPGPHCVYCDVRKHCAVGQAHLLSRPEDAVLAGVNEGLVSL